MTTGIRTVIYPVADLARAKALFDSRCSAPASGSFALYKLYGSAAAFAGVAP